MALPLAGLAWSAACLLALAGSAAIAAEGIGMAVSVDTEIVAGKAGAEQPLTSGGQVYADDRIVTNLSGIGQIEFRDKTRLAIGPGSTLTLDRFVYDPKRNKTDIVMGFGKGTFRFITGSGTHKGYSIDTPTATIGVRGTAFDVYVAGDGEMAVAMINGTVDVCSKKSLACQAHDKIGSFLIMTTEGVFSLRDKWDGTFMKGVGFAAAMPFMVGDNVLRPTFRAGSTVLRRYAAATGEALGTVGKAAGQAAEKAVEAPVKAIQTVPRALQNLNPFKR